MRGFGNYKSGLKEIDEAKYDQLVDLFKRRGRRVYKRQSISRDRRKQDFNGMGRRESDDHKDLKLYVASDPARILKEKGLRTLEVEFPFDSGDRADIVLEDHVGRVIGLEIEVAVNRADVTGVLQAIKYRYMLAFVHRCKFKETRSFLVAYSITPDLKKICKAYSVECFTISRRDVRRWRDG